MRRVLSTGFVFSLILFAGLTQISNKAGSAGPFGDPEDVKFSIQLWQAMADARLVGDQSITAMPYEGSVHKTILITMDSTVLVDGRTAMVIVKKMYQGDGISTEAVVNDPTRNLKIVAVMFKREKGYDPENKDWFYGKFNPDGTLQKNKKGMQLGGRPGPCIACHKSAPGGSYVYSFDR